MKKILVTLALVAMTTGAFAQSFGVRFGANLNDIAGIGDTDHSAINLGAYAGAVVDLALPVANFGLRIEPAFSLQGASRKGELVVGTKFEDTYNSSYVNVPFYAEYKLLGGNLSLMAGPQLGFCVGMEHKNVLGSTSATTKYDSDDINTFDFGVGFGISYMITSDVAIDLRYNLGLGNISKADDTTWQNRVISIGAAYLF